MWWEKRAAAPTMDAKAGGSQCGGEDAEVRKGPWTMEEDLILMNYIATHGEGVWNSVAKSAGLKRTGKSCRLRWLNYLRPDVRRGNITAEEELLIIELHSRWGNRWSKIAKQLPGRTDNEIKNYWRTRIQKRFKFAESYEQYEPQMSDPDPYQLHTPLPAPLPETGGAAPMDCGGMDSCCSPDLYADVHGCNPEDFAGAAPPPPGSSSTGELMWDAEDLWSMHMFNND